MKREVLGLCRTVKEFINHSLLSYLKSIVCTMQVTVILDFGYLINAFCVSCLHINKKSRTNGDKWSYILKMFVKKNKFKLNKEKEIFFSEWDFVNNMACKS